MKKIFLMIITIAALASCALKGTVYTNPLDVKFGDPYVLLGTRGL